MLSVSLTPKVSPFQDRANWGEKCVAGSKGLDAAICAALPAAQRLMLQEISTALGPDAIVLAKDTSKTDPSPLCPHLRLRAEG